MDDVDSTVIRQVNMSAMMVGPDGDAADKVATKFEQARLRVVRVNQAAAACEKLAQTMPQIVVVLGNLRPDERDALADRATAVGALVFYVDPALDDETLDELVGRAALAAIERKMRRDESGPAGAMSDPPSTDDDVDSQW